MSRTMTIWCDACGRTINPDAETFAGGGIQESFTDPDVLVRVDGDYCQECTCPVVVAVREAARAVTKAIQERNGGGDL